MTANDNDNLFGDHRDPEEIREDIRETTADITEKLEAIQAKLQPDAIVAEATEEVKDRALSLLAKARNHPAAVTLLGLGAMVVVGRAIAGGRSGQGSGLLTLAVGAVIGAAAYRLIAGDAYREEDEADAQMTQEINPATLPAPAVLS